MALSQSPARPASKKRKPDPARVVQSYWHEVQARGKRGALRRTGDLYNISDESVRRYLAADEQRAQVKSVDAGELAYSPAPGQSSYEAERDRLAAAQRKVLTPKATTAPTIRHKPRPTCHGLKHGTHGRVRVIIMSSEQRIERGTVAYAPHMPQSTIATRHTAERAQRPAEWQPMPQTPAHHTTALPSATVKRYAPRPKRNGVDLAQLIDLAMLMVGPVPLIAWVIVAAVVLLLGMQ